MNWFKNMKIRTKMLVSFMLVIALTMTLVGIAVTRITRVSEDYLIAINHPLNLRSCLWEIQNRYLDISRVVATLSAYAGKNPTGNEALFNDARTAYDASLACLDRAILVVNTNPKLSQDEKNARTANNDILRGLFRQYYDEVVTPVMNAARANDHESSLKTIGSTAAIVSAVREKIDEMLESAIATADNQIRRTERDVDAAIALLAAISLGTALVAVVIALYVANFIGKPLVPLTGFMREAADAGIYTFRPEDVTAIGKSAKARDELGQMITAATAFVGRVADIGNALEKVAGGDLASGLPLLSDRDTIGLALKKMTEHLHAMFEEINSSSVKVSISANQVADGAQGLASGSMQQSASVEELSVSISEVAEKTKSNAEMAGNAATLADSIKGDAEKGNFQMEEMMTAVKQISEASRSISKVMKTIDDIAFQTNILALNAAVEAARAGRHGKGFAVVAEEVRNLAAKSAEAAKDTEGIIANSIERAELGVRIAGETSASLLEIVSGITESNRLVSEIARLAAEQSLNISQIKTGIDQVAQVAHQNSVTAEESAAAAEEMNRQSAVLQKLVSRFRLKREPIARNRAPGEERQALQRALRIESQAGDAGRFAGRLLDTFPK